MVGFPNPAPLCGAETFRRRSWARQRRVRRLRQFTGTAIDALRIILDARFGVEARPASSRARSRNEVHGWRDRTSRRLHAAALYRDGEPSIPPEDTMLGALCRYVSHSGAGRYQPMNAAFGLLPPPPPHVRGKTEKREARSHRALGSLDSWLERHGTKAQAESLP
jgi:methylenetetrahydrofolate--tRNA-(uracil-5-)-methyltransferase